MTSLERTPVYPITSPSAPRWWTSPAGRCRSCTPPEWSPNTSPPAARAGLFDVSHMGRFAVARRRARSRSSSASSATTPPPSTWARPSTPSSPPRPAARSTTPTSTGSSPTSTCWWSTPPTARRTGPPAGAATWRRSAAEAPRPAASPSRTTRPRWPCCRSRARCPGRSSRGLLTAGALPEPRRNELSVVADRPARVLLGRTGYTGEPLCFELFVPAEHAASRLGSSRPKRSRSLWPRRAGHPAPGGRPASLRKRVGHRSGGQTRSPSCPRPWPRSR